MELNSTLTPKPLIDWEQGYQQFFARKIDFFGLGIAELAARPCTPSECAESSFFVTFQVTGDEQGLCAVAFSHAPTSDDDRSMAVELANILASKFVTQLADANCSAIMVSPPTEVTSGEQKHRYLTSTFLAAGPRDAIVRRYDYSGSTKLTLKLAYLPARNGGIA